MNLAVITHLLFCLATSAFLPLASSASGTPAPKESLPQREHNEWAIGVPRYAVGGVVGSLLGFGLGHMIQGRWWDGHGWGFTMGGLFTYLNWEAAEEQNKTFPLLLFLGTKLGETIDVWMPPLRSDYFPDRQTMTTSRYVTGGILGTIIGFGSGHLVQGRGVAAWPYALTQVSALATVVAECHSCKEDGSFDPVTPLFGLMMYTLSRVLETISVWWPGARNYEIVSRAPSPPKLAIVPLLYSDNPKLALQLTVAL